MMFTKLFSITAFAENNKGSNGVGNKPKVKKEVKGNWNTVYAGKRSVAPAPKIKRSSGFGGKKGV